MPKRELKILFVYSILRFPSSVARQSSGMRRDGLRFTVTVDGLGTADIQGDGTPTWSVLWFAENMFLEHIEKNLHPDERVCCWEASLASNPLVKLSRQEITLGSVPQ